MGHQVTIGGDRIGSGKKLKTYVKGFERSTHDLSFAWRSSMAQGTLVPCLKVLGLPGDTFDIDMDAFVKTLPTTGPLFGSYKLQLDVFVAPFRLYQAVLHNNKLGVGNNMASVLLPHFKLTSGLLVDPSASGIPYEKQQVNPSCILSYLGVKGVGHQSGSAAYMGRQFNAIPWLAYWDIYKNYYANKQEDNGYYMHRTSNPLWNWYHITWVLYDYNSSGTTETQEIPNNGSEFGPYPTSATTAFYITVDSGAGGSNGSNIYLVDSIDDEYRLDQLFNQVVKWSDDGTKEIWRCGNPKSPSYNIKSVLIPNSNRTWNNPTSFPLANIDSIREQILSYSISTRYVLKSDSLAPFGPVLDYTNKTALNAMEGLGLKTYQSDIFNNWVKTDWISGANGISEVTKISTASGSFTMDTLNLSQKLYNMLTKIAISGGTYNDWIGAVYDNGGFWTNETPVYVGGLSKEVVFQEVVSQSASGDEPLGQLAGKGVMSGKNKGGKCHIKINEPSYIMGIISLTPRLDYSQGNEWDTQLLTMNDLHKPDLDEIGFQDLLTDQMAFWDTQVASSSNPEDTGTVTKYSAGKQPAWLNYMTNYNKTFGDFADESDKMFMTLNRNYTPNTTTMRISDLTTYIFPNKFNYMFAQSSLSAQNFWTQIGFKITARRKISARLIPNL